MNHVVAETLLVYSPAPYSGYPMAWRERWPKLASARMTHSERKTPLQADPVVDCSSEDTHHGEELGISFGL